LRLSICDFVRNAESRRTQPTSREKTAPRRAQVKEFAIGGQHFAFNSQPAIMGVINLSADSWYRESVCLSTEAAVRRGQVLHAQGAAIIDLGAESTLAHATAGRRCHPDREIPARTPGAARGPYSRVGGDVPSRSGPDALEAGANLLNLTGTIAPRKCFEWWPHTMPPSFCVTSQGKKRS
jgi:hypothetical protein